MTKNLLPAPLYAVSQEWEYNGRDDSDFYRVMYNPNKDTLERVETHSTRYGSGYLATVTGEYARKNRLSGYIANEYKRDFDGKIDSLDTVNILVPLPVTWFVRPEETPERVWVRAERLYADMLFNSFTIQDKLKAKQPTKSKLCLVISGRKIKKGAIVRVTGEPKPDVYGYNNNGFKALCSVGGAFIRTNLRNLEVINPEQYETLPYVLRDKANEIAKSRDFYHAFRTSAVSLV